MGAKKRQKAEIPLQYLQIRVVRLPICPRDLYESQNDKHSDLRSEASVTVMAVAADFHRNFLIPERRDQTPRARQHRISVMICVYSFVWTYYNICCT